MYCNNCGSEAEEGGRFCPSCGSAIETTASEVAPVANPREGRIQPEAFSGSREGHRQAPPSENVTMGNSEGRFSTRVPKKGLILAILAVVLVAGLGAGGYWWMRHRTAAVTVSGNDIVIEKGTQAPAETKPEEKPAEAKTPAPAPEKPAPAPAPKVVKKAPAKKPAPQASQPPNTPWRYKVESPAPKPAPQAQPRAQASKNQNPLGKLFDVFQGPAPDVTPAPAPNDARGTGM